MIELIFRNAKGMEMNAIYNDYMTITAIEALHGVDNEFSSSTSPYFDGDVVNHIRTNPRPIVLTYALKTSNMNGKKKSIADSLDFFNSMVKSKQMATLIETRDDGSKIEIEGIVTVPPYTRLTEQVAVQINLYCSDPYWEDVLNMITEISTTIDMHYFPYDNEEKLLAGDGGIAFVENGNPYTNSHTGITYSGIPISELDINSRKIITNEGDVATGMLIKIKALRDIKNPRIVQNDYNYIQINTTMEENDWIEISTVKGNKYVTSYRGNVSIANVVYSGNDWLQLETGVNEFYGTAVDPVDETQSRNDAVLFSIYYKRKWQ